VVDRVVPVRTRVLDHDHCVVVEAQRDVYPPELLARFRRPRCSYGSSPPGSSAAAFGERGTNPAEWV
jgi:hypothetical protein